MLLYHLLSLLYFFFQFKPSRQVFPIYALVSVSDVPLFSSSWVILLVICACALFILTSYVSLLDLVQLCVFYRCFHFGPIGMVLAHCHVILFPSAYFQSCCPSLVRSSQCFPSVTVCFVDFVSLQIKTSLLEICLKSAFVGLQPSLNRTWCKPVRCVVIDTWHIFMGIKAFEYLCTLPLPASP